MQADQLPGIVDPVLREVGLSLRARFLTDRKRGPRAMQQRRGQRVLDEVEAAVCEMLARRGGGQDVEFGSRIAREPSPSRVGLEHVRAVVGATRFRGELAAGEPGSGEAPRLDQHARKAEAAQDARPVGPGPQVDLASLIRVEQRRRAGVTMTRSPPRPSPARRGCGVFRMEAAGSVILPRTMHLNAPLSPGEFLDKQTILEIKLARIADPAALENVRRELDLLRLEWAASPFARADVAAQVDELRKVNETLWEIEDRIRLKEKDQAFDAEFVELRAWRLPHQRPPRRDQARDQRRAGIGPARGEVLQGLTGFPISPGGTDSGTAHRRYWFLSEPHVFGCAGTAAGGRRARR